MSVFNALIDRTVTDSLWPEPVRIVRVQPRGARFEVWAEGTETRQTHKRFLDEATLQALLESHTGATDFAADPELFALGVEARRIQLGHTFDPFFAVSTSRIDPLPHQLEAVYGTLLQKPRVRFLLADDPGAGKTVMAGLLLKELKYRGVLERILIVTPANLTDQWRREMKEKFSERFEVVNRDTAAALYDENPWTARDQLIASVDFAKQALQLSQLEHASWDLVIVDEAHKLSATRYGRELKKSLRYRLGEVLSRTSAQLLFLSATPHQGDEEKFRLLLDLLEPDLFATRAILEEAAQAGENPIMLRRLKEDMVNFEGQQLFPRRVVHSPTFTLTPSERQLYARVTEYVQKHFKLAWQEKKRNVGLAMTVLQRRLASSTYAIARSLAKRHARLSKLKSEVLELDDHPAQNLSDEELDDLPEEERWRIEDEISERLTLAKNMVDLEREIRELARLVEDARVLARAEQDRKLSELQRIVASLPAGEKLLIFTEHKDTLDFLLRVLRKGGHAVTHIDGGMRLKERVAAEHEFKHQARIMVATEAAGEGINLQFCAVMVNYDLPWNPTRLEQRMGRVHRYGQKFEVHIYNLVAEGTREGEVLGRLLTKLEAMRAELGSDRVYDVVGELLSGVNLERMITEHLLGRKNLAEIQAVVDAHLSPERIDYLRDITLERLAQRELDLSKLRAKQRDSQLQRLQPEYIERFFLRAFHRLGGQARQRQDGLWRFKVPYDLRQEREGVPAELPRASFDAREEEAADVITPGQPLFDAVLSRTLREAAPALQQGAAFALPQAEQPSTLAHLELAVVDGLGETVSRRLFACLKGSEVRPLEPRALVDAAPSDPPEPAVVDAQGTRDALIGWAYEHLLDAFVDEVRQTREREVGIRRKYGVRSLEYLIRESTKKLADYKVKARKGEDMDLATRQEERRQRTLKERLEALTVRLDQEANLQPEPAELTALAYVVPVRLDAGLDEHEHDPEVRRQVELAAMQVAMRHEQEQGREPRDVSAENVGYDIASSERAIEVKGRAGSGPIVLTPNEWIVARRLGESYFLYVVTNALEAPALYIIENPAAKLSPNEEISVVRYIVSEPDWQRAAEGANEV